MASPLDAGIVVAYLLLLGVLAVQYRRGAVPRERLPLLVGACLTWLAYGMLQLSQGDLVPTAGPLNYALDGLAVLLLVVGLSALYRWWQNRDSEEPAE